MLKFPNVQQEAGNDKKRKLPKRSLQEPLLVHPCGVNTNTFSQIIAHAWKRKVNTRAIFGKVEYDFQVVIIKIYAAQKMLNQLFLIRYIADFSILEFL